MQALIPVTVVTGFLGSGKTTLLSSLLERRQTRRLAILINEFGEVSIDGPLIRQAADGDDLVQIHDFAYGLIAYGDDEKFIPTMQAIAKRRANFDHILIETSGLALPTAVMELLQSPQLSSDFILDATLAVVDTPLLLSDNFDRSTGESNTQAVGNSIARLFEQQLEFADVVVLNKIDELNEDQLLVAETRIRARAPNVRFLELAYKAQLDIRLALGLRLHQPTLIDNTHRYTALPTMPEAGSAPLANQALLNGHSHSGMASHSHGLATHKHFHEQDPGWLSFVIRTTELQNSAILQQALVEIAKVEPVLRTKGFIRTDAQTMVVQGVRTRITVNQSTENKHEDAQPETKSELVFIGYHLNRNHIAKLLADMTNSVWR
jgi:cobalamin biosynthesis protein CobW